MQVHEARVLFRPTAGYEYLPEGPRALPDGQVAWVTIQRGPDRPQGALHVLDPATGDNRTFDLPGRPGFALPTADADVFLLGMERAIGWFDCHSGTFDVVVDGIDDHCDGTILNDAEPCPQGLFFGLKDTAFRDAKAGLYFLRRSDSALFRLRDDRLCSNGKVVRETDDRHIDLFDIDTPTRVVRGYRFDPATGGLGRERIAIDLRHERGLPDGMCGIPGTSDVVVAMFDPDDAAFGRALRCSLDTGEVMAEYRTPLAAQVTCPAFVPTTDGALLVLTTAAEHLTPERRARQPDAGCLFAVAL